MGLDGAVCSQVGLLHVRDVMTFEAIPKKGAHQIELPPQFLLSVFAPVPLGCNEMRNGFH